MGKVSLDRVPDIWIMPPDEAVKPDTITTAKKHPDALSNWQGKKRALIQHVQIQ